MDITVRLDTRELEARMTGAAAEILKGLRSAVDKAARQSRKDAIKEGAADMNVSNQRAGKNIPKVRASTMSSLSASWNIPTIEIGALEVIGVSLAPGGGGLRFNAYRRTGGKSAALSAPKAFRISGANSGKELAMIRFGKGRRDIRKVEGEMLITSMRQGDGAARKLWEREASAKLHTVASEAVAAALAGSKASSDGGSD